MLTSQPRGIPACDLFTADTVFLDRIYMLFFPHPATRGVHAAGGTAHPTARGPASRSPTVLVDLDDRAEHSVRFPVRHRDATFTTAFDAVFIGQVERGQITAVRWASRHDTYTATGVSPA